MKVMIIEIVVFDLVYEYSLLSSVFRHLHKTIICLSVDPLRLGIVEEHNSPTDYDCFLAFEIGT